MCHRVFRKDKIRFTEHILRKMIAFQVLLLRKNKAVMGGVLGIVNAVVLERHSEMFYSHLLVKKLVLFYVVDSICFADKHNV